MIAELKCGMEALAGTVEEQTSQIPWVLSVNLHGVYEYLAEPRFQGGSFKVNIAKKF